MSPAKPKAAERVRIDYLPLDQLTPAIRNPKKHLIPQLRRSIERFGFADPIEFDERTGHLVAGHGRLESLTAMRDDGKYPPQGIHVDDNGTWLVPVVRGWASRSDAEAEAYLVANNQLTIGAGWDEPELGELLSNISQTDATLLDATGFADDDITALLAAPDPASGEAATGPESTEGEGEAITLAGVTVGEPEHSVKSGDVWKLGARHILVVACPHRQWPLWVPYLTGDAVLLPYPSPHATLAQTPGDGLVVLVQPNEYLAGWLVTKWVRVTGGTPERIGQVSP